VVGASKIARDVTERKRLENDLRRLAADLSEADRRKDEFLATLAHELRNPLAPLVNMVEVLKLAEGDPELQRRARETIERQLGQLVRLVDDLLDLNRITHNRLELRLGDVELEAVIQQAVEVVRPLADAVGHDLQVTLPEESVHLHADPARLAQVFGNLLNNSSRYTPPGGRIWVTAERSGTDVEVIVGDTGSGIPADKLESIFEMFAQADGSTDQPQGGLGIGLTLVRQLVQMHGGSVVARSAGAGRGSEFVVRLPVAVAKAAPAPAPPAPRAPSQRRRILIVDDNEDAAESLALLLAAAGHETHVAHDGVAAVEAAERLRPDAVLLDIGLPKLSGYEACRRIRQQPWARDILLVALTGWGQVDDRRKSEEAGFDDHLVKPVNHGVLIEMLAARVGAAD
jgi:CheY-like chemotaxis protein/nitrogen-specific signal transduction histidine kinase